MDAPEKLGWLYVDFNSYFASIEQQMHPVLRGKPVAVIPLETEATSAIAASYEAKAFGIRTGTPIYEARKLCPDLICVVARHDHYVRYHHLLIEEIDRHIPVTDVCSIDEMACKLMRNECAPEQAIQIAHNIKAGIAKNVGEYIRCSIGIAPNRYLAKIATDLKKPDGLTILSPQDLPERLYELHLRDLPGIGPRMETRLNQAGIRTMRQLMALPPKQMRAVWGNLWGEKIWYMLRGIQIDTEKSDRHSIGHSQVLSPEHRPPDHARIVARRLMIKTAARLRRMKMKTRQLSLSARTEDGYRFAAETSFQPVQDSFTLLDLLDDLWQRIAPQMRGKRLKKVSITVSSLSDEEHTQSDLFDTVPHAEKEQKEKFARISEAMDQLNHKFGRDTIMPGLLKDQSRNFSGTKVAFTRIPDMEEFLE